MTHTETKQRRLSTRERSIQQALDQLIDQLNPQQRIAADPIRFPKRYGDPLDQEVVALIAALLSYGRVKSIGDTIENLLPALGKRPAKSALEDFKRQSSNETTPNRFEDFIYRFTRPPDLERVWRGFGYILFKHKSLGHCMRAYNTSTDPHLLTAYQGLYNEVIESTLDFPSSRGFHHLFSKFIIGT